MDIQPSRNDLQPCFNRLKNYLNTLNGHTKYVSVLDQQLQSLNDDLNKIYDLLNQLLTICKQRVTEGDLPIRFNASILQQNVVVMYLIDDLDTYDTTFSHLLDIMELNEYEPHFDLVIDLVESCNFAKNRLQPLLTNLKVYIDIILEYHEISNDNMRALDTIINDNIDDLFRIQDAKYESPIRHMPSFTLKQLLNILQQDNTSGNNSTNRAHKMLNSNLNQNNNSHLKLPKFSPMEEKLINKFIEIQNNLRPIETSLLDILPQRLQQFEKRHQITNNQVDTHVLVDQVKDDYRRILRNFKYLNSEINCLRIDLVDKRWNIIFTNLNHELEFLLNEINKNYETLLRINADTNTDNTTIDDINSLLPSFNIESNLKSQIERNTNIVAKTFDVIYAASEFSLLDENVASKTNELAQYWVKLRPKSDSLLITVGNKLNSQISSKEEAVTTINKHSTINNPVLDFLEPPPPILSSRRYSNNSKSSNGSDSESDIGNKTIEAIANDLRTFSLGSSNIDTKIVNNQNNSSATKRNASDLLIKSSSLISVSPRRNNTSGNSTTVLKTGAKLLEKMHIKPIIISTSIAASASTDMDDEENPFFDSDAHVTMRPQTEPQSNATKKSIRKQKTRSLILTTIPSLRHEDSGGDDYNNQIPDVVRDPLVHTVSSSLTMLSSRSSVEPSNSPEDKLLPSLNTNHDTTAAIGDTTADTVIINDIEENEENEENMLVDNDIGTESPPRYNSDISFDSLNTPTLDVHEDDSGSKIISASSSPLSPSSTSSVIADPQFSSILETPLIEKPRSEHSSYIQYSPASFNKLLDEKITLNRNKPSLIPRIEKKGQKSSIPHSRTIPSPTDGPNAFMPRRIKAPTPLSQLLTRKPSKVILR